MKLFRSLAILGFLLLILAGVIGLIWTRGTSSGSVSSGHRQPAVDEAPYQTAQQMAKLASSWDEFRLAQQALKLSDHEVDLAFADALRDATERPPQLTPEGRQLYARLNKAQAAVKDDQSHIDDLKKQLASANAVHQDALQQRLDIIQAQMELDQDELDDAREDLARSGVDPLSRIQRQFSRRQAAQQNTSASFAPPNNSNPPGNDFFEQFI